MCGVYGLGRPEPASVANVGGKIASDMALGSLILVDCTYTHSTAIAMAVASKTAE